MKISTSVLRSGIFVSILNPIKDPALLIRLKCTCTLVRSVLFAVVKTWVLNCDAYIPNTDEGIFK